MRRAVANVALGVALLVVVILGVRKLTMRTGGTSHVVPGVAVRSDPSVAGGLPEKQPASQDGDSEATDEGEAPETAPVGQGPMFTPAPSSDLTAQPTSDKPVVIDLTPDPREALAWAVDAVKKVRTMSYTADRYAMARNPATGKEERKRIATGAMRWSLFEESPYGFMFRAKGESFGYLNKNLTFDVAFDGLVANWVRDDVKKIFRDRLRAVPDLMRLGGAYAILPVDLIGKNLQRAAASSSVLQVGNRSISGVDCTVVRSVFKQDGVEIESIWSISVRDHLPRAIEFRRRGASSSSAGKKVQPDFMLVIGNLEVNEPMTVDEFRVDPPPGYTLVRTETPYDRPRRRPPPDSP